MSLPRLSSKPLLSSCERLFDDEVDSSSIVCTETLRRGEPVMESRESTVGLLRIIDNEDLWDAMEVFCLLIEGFMFPKRIQYHHHLPFLSLMIFLQEELPLLSKIETLATPQLKVPILN